MRTKTVQSICRAIAISAGALALGSHVAHPDQALDSIVMNEARIR